MFCIPGPAINPERTVPLRTECRRPSGDRERASRRQPELVRGISRILLEHAAQVMGILEPQFIGDFTNGFIGGAKELLGFVHQLDICLLYTSPSPRDRG